MQMTKKNKRKKSVHNPITIILQKNIFTFIMLFFGYSYYYLYLLDE